ncbi:N5-carboxyethyl-ornithine synthase [Lactococcus lactis subsp. lactis IO-1]|nr:N5-carboxyethyl-ornithine synthase [Lactococcus lactis subsp. lactis IO-1]
MYLRNYAIEIITYLGLNRQIYTSSYKSISYIIYNKKHLYYFIFLLGY